MAFLVLPLVLEKIVETVVIVGAAAATAVVANEVIETTTKVVSRATSSSSSSSSTPAVAYKTIYDWWGNGLTGEEKNILVDECFLDLKEGTFCLEYLNREIDSYYLKKEPRKPTEEDGFKPKKNWDGKPVKAPNSQKRGYPHEDGSVWVPTGSDSENVKQHGGPHWDREYPNGTHKNVRPKKNK